MEKCNSIKELFGMLESSDSIVVEEIKVLVHESLNNTREPWLLNALVDYYVAFQSERCLDIIVGVREPHDKFLFDKLAECLKGKTRPQSLMLLGHVVRKQPSWLYKIATHKLFTSLLHVLKTDTDIPNLMSALLILVTLLPVVPASIGPFLQEIFDIFSRLAAWNTKKPSNVPAVFLLHLQVGLYSLFHRLYAMYPCNFLAYLRSCYGHRDPNREYSNRDTLQVFTKTIKPMLERVRLHPLLVTASKDGELTTAMWKKMEMHDIIVECAKLSLDVTEGAWEESLNAGQWLHNQLRDQRFTGSDRHTFTPILSDLSLVVGQLTSQYSVSKDADTPSAQDVSTSGNIWSPSHNCGLATPPVAPSVTSVEQTSFVAPQTNSTPQSRRNSPPLDVAVEATPDNPLRNTTSSEVKSMDETQNILQSVNACLDYEKQIESVHSSFQTSLTSDTSEDAKEDEAADKEVSDIVDNMISSKPSNDEAGQATPFLSTTHNLTCGLPAEKVGYEVPLDENELYSSNKYNENHLPMEQFFRNISRLRYFSQCGQPPDIPVEWVQESKSFKRAQSCPTLQQIGEVSDSVTATEISRLIADSTGGLVKPEAGSPSTSRTASSSEGPSIIMGTTTTTTPPSTSFIPVQNVSCSSQTTTEQLSYEHLFSLALMPLPHLLDPEQCQVSGNQKTVQATEQTKTVYSVNQYSTLSSTFTPEVPLFTTLSPPEVLDRHLQFGSDIYLKEVSSLPLTSSKNTNWTHFGGQAPIDEINILRGQVSLLHSQLLYERHKREIHAERNRRLLGKAKRTRALEEQNVAMKDQLHLIEKESQELFYQLNIMQQKIISMENDKDQQAQKLQDNLKSALEENERLNFSNRELQQLLVSHKQENDSLKKELQKTQAELFEATVELSSVQREAAGCEVLRKEVDHLRKELTLYGEVHLRLRKQVEASRPKPQLEQELELMQQAAAAELKNFKDIFNTRNAHLEFYKSALHDLEKVSATKDTVINEQKSLMETLKQTHRDQIKALEKRIYSLQNICQQLESHIMELYEQIDKSQFTTPRILGRREHTDIHSLSTARFEQVSTITDEDGSSQRDLISSVCQTTNGTTIAESNLNNSGQSIVSSDQSLWSLTQSVEQELDHPPAENPSVENSLANSHFLDVEGPVTTEKCPQ